MTDTANLGLPVIEAAQAQKHVTHNEALRILDALVQLAVLDRDLSVPPASPVEGKRWIVAASPTDAWVGHAGEIAAWQDGAWQFSTPQNGWLAFVIDENKLVVWDGSAWDDVFAAITALQNLTLLGVGTTADGTNPFSAKLNTALWTAKPPAEGGDGNLRSTLNKEGAADVVSLLLQSGFSARAEIGLIGDDNLTLKTSADGSTWNTALVADRTSGAVSLPNTPAATRGLMLPQTRTLIGAMTNEPRRARTLLIDTLITSLVDAGVWAKLDALYVFAAADSQAALLNWINPTGTAASAVNSPTFTANRGYAGDGATSYIDTNLPLTSGPNYTLNDASAFAWSLTESAETAAIVGTIASTPAQTRMEIIPNASGSLITRFNDGTNNSASLTTSLGLFVICRAAVGNYQRYHNSSFLDTVTQDSTSIPTGNLATRANTFPTRQVAVIGSGAALTGTEATALYDALYAYLHDSTVGAV
jgi:hypothetical protein